MRFAKLAKLGLAAVLALAGVAVMAQEATIRKNLKERIPQLPNIAEISKSPMAGLFEVRLEDNDIMYTDAEGNFLINGHLIDTKLRRNLTEERVEKLTAVAFSALPVKDAFTIVRGNGKRKIAVFEDPNCGYCKRFEQDIQKLDNVTVYMYLFPILSPDSTEKARNIWCAKDKAKSWQDWMVRGQTPASASCEASALTRNVEFGKKYRITGTPTLIFEDGKRVPGAISSAEVEKYLVAAAKN